jgi:L-threonylcarbamoyladenylate synthase
VTTSSSPPEPQARGRSVSSAQLLPAGPGAAVRAGEVLRAGGLVAMPTETVYGLAADATSDAAVARIYEAKGRPSFNPLIAHVPDLAAAQRQGAFNADALALARAFWPGPLTLVTPVAQGCAVSLLARAGLDTLALRAPDHPAAQAILRAAGRPLAAPSANRSGRVSPTLAAHVAADLADRIDLIVDAGPSAVGVESTIVACIDATPRLLRPGGIAREEIERVLGRPLAEPEPENAPGGPLAPGMLASHYAPRARVRLDATSLEPGEAALDFAGALAGKLADALADARGSAKRLDLSPAGDLREAAAHLFDYLRRLDQPDVQAIAVAPIPRAGLGEAINDRLARAAAPRG